MASSKLSGHLVTGKNSISLLIEKYSVPKNKNSASKSFDFEKIRPKGPSGDPIERPEDVQCRGIQKNGQSNLFLLLRRSRSRYNLVLATLN